jgi:hypothetical protein
VNAVSGLLLVKTMCAASWGLTLFGRPSGLAASMEAMAWSGVVGESGSRCQRMRRCRTDAVVLGRNVFVGCGGKVAAEDCKSEGDMRRFPNECLLRSPGNAAAAGGRLGCSMCQTSLTC